jgi:hypothetical protein
MMPLHGMRHRQLRRQWLFPSRGKVSRYVGGNRHEGACGYIGGDIGRCKCLVYLGIMFIFVGNEKL